MLTCPTSAPNTLNFVFQVHHPEVFEHTLFGTDSRARSQSAPPAVRRSKEAKGWPQSCLGTRAATCKPNSNGADSALTRDEAGRAPNAGPLYTSLSGSDCDTRTWCVELAKEPTGNEI